MNEATPHADVSAPPPRIHLSIVIPMYNEERNVPLLFERLLPVCRALPLSWEIICVDDGSRDHTAKMVQIAQDKCAEMKLVRFARNFGQHAAVTAGFMHASGAWIITMDADLQNPPEEIPKLVGCFTTGHDLVNTWRMQRQDTWFRKLASRLTNKLVRRISGIQLDDFGCMLRGYSQEVAQAIVNCREYKTFIPALASLFARKPVSIGVAHEERASGRSNYSLTRLFALQLDLITSFSIHPLRLLFVTGVAFATLGTLLGSLLLILRLVLGATWAANGTLTVLGILLIFTGFQFFALGILGEYIGRIFQQVRLREPFIIASVAGGIPASPKALS